MTSTNPVALLTPSDVAELAGVKRPVVSNWRKRHKDFPAPVAGSTGKPLFERGAVITWLESRGYRVRNVSPGTDLWAAMNALRGYMTVDDSTRLVVLLSVIRHSDEASFTRLAALPEAQVHHGVASAASNVSPRDLTAGSDDLLGHNRLNADTLSAVVGTIAQIPQADLAGAVDSALQRLSRSQAKSGAEAGFIGSRTSDILAALATQCQGTVYDPACGIANVLVQVGTKGRATKLVGSDINRRAVQVAAQRAFLRDLPIELSAGDALAHDPNPGLKADVVVTEPPFGMKWDPTLSLQDSRFSFGLPSKMSSELAWIQNAISHTRDGGRAYIITPMGTLSQIGAAKQIRANLLSAGCIEAIIGLPPRLLPQTAIPLALWALRPATTSTPGVLLIDAGDVADPAAHVADWLSEVTVPPGNVPSVTMAVTELLAADANLTPAHWVGGQDIDAAEIAKAQEAAADEISDEMRLIGSHVVDLRQLSGLAESRISSVKELVDLKVLEVALGRFDKRRNLDGRMPNQAVTASDVRARSLPSVNDLTFAPDVTQPGDVLVTTVNEVHAVVDEEGGHLLAAGVDRLRILDSSALDSSYLAAVLSGSWNKRFLSGATIRRARIRELEVPLIPRQDQARVSQFQDELTSLLAHALRLAESTRDLKILVLDAVRFSAANEPHYSREDQ